MQAFDGGGVLMNQFIYMVDLLQYLMGLVQFLFVYIDIFVYDIEVEDMAVVALCFINGVLG